MNAGSRERRRVAGWARVLSWLVAIASAAAFLGVALAVLNGRPLPSVPWYRLVMFSVATVWVAPLFWIVAITWARATLLAWLCDASLTRR